MYSLKCWNFPWLRDSSNQDSISQVQYPRWWNLLPFLPFLSWQWSRHLSYVSYFLEMQKAANPGPRTRRPWLFQIISSFHWLKVWRRELTLSKMGVILRWVWLDICRLAFSERIANNSDTFQREVNGVACESFTVSYSSVSHYFKVYLTLLHTPAVNCPFVLRCGRSSQQTTIDKLSLTSSWLYGNETFFQGQRLSLWFVVI